MEEDLKKNVANNIAKFRKMAGLTQFELAEKLNYSDKAVSKWEKGDSLPDIVVLKQIANLFNMTLDDLTLANTNVNIVNVSHPNKFYISAIASLIVWLVAVSAFVIGYLITENISFWIIFVYAIPVNCIVLISLNKFWKNKWYNFGVVTMLILSTILSLFLSLNIRSVWLLFTIAVPLIAMAYLWFVSREKTIKITNDFTRLNKN